MAGTNWRDVLGKSENVQLMAQLGLGAMGALGAKGDRDYARDLQKQNRGDSILDKQRNAYLGRAGASNDLTQSGMDDDYRNANAVAELTDPYKYKRELQRDTNRAMQLKKAAQMLGMPTSGLFNEMNTDDAILRRNANAVLGTEMNATDISPGRSARDIGQSMGMSPMSSAVQGQNNQLSQYAGQKNQALAGTRQGMMDTMNQGYDKYDDSIKAQLLAGKDGDIDPETGKKKTSMWRKVLGGAVKYGVPIALAATGVGIPAAAAMAAGGSFGGDMIAGKGVKDSVIGAGLSAIPGGNIGAGGVGQALGKNIASKVGQTAVQQGLRAASDNIPYVGAGLAIGNGMLPQAIGNSPMAAAVSGKGRPLGPQQGFTTYRPQLTSGLKPTGPFSNVRF